MTDHGIKGCTYAGNKDGHHRGSIENRARFLFEVLDAVLEVWPSNRVGVKTGPMSGDCSPP
jgi:2,4-dienoyl-CoA reductase-like NADH-dependent reductase (Old Yellow Enzyme family)